MCLYIYIIDIETSETHVVCRVFCILGFLFKALHPHGRRPCIPVTWSRRDGAGEWAGFWAPEIVG